MKMRENKSRFIFFGTAEFSTIILEKLIKAGFISEAVVCNPDKPTGRKKIITPPPIKILAEKHNIDILQPKIPANCKLSISNYKPDFFIVAAYAKIIPKEILEIPRLGTIGVHPSLLPKYRGSSPIQTAILNGEKETGTTLYLMDEKVDNGKIISNLKSQISKTDNYESLMQKLAELSADLLIDFLQKINQYLGSPTSQKLRNIKEVGLPEIGIKLLPQNESQSTYTKKFTTEDAFIKHENLETAKEQGGKIAVEIERKIRALNPEPGVFTIINNKRMKILEVKLTLEGKLKLKKIQFEGKKPVEIKN